MIQIDRVIVVEGKYDVIALSRIVDAVIIETSGFQIFQDKEKLELLRTLAKRCGLILLTDSDRAGMAIRNFLIGSIGAEYIRNAYIPERYGTEHRKKHPSKEGKLGVEGMDEETLEQILWFASAPKQNKEELTTLDLYFAGLLGQPDSANKRMKLQKQLGLPSHLSPKKFLEILNAIIGKAEFETMIKEQNE